MPLSLVVLLALTQSSTDLVAPGATLRVLGEGYKFTEGPAVDRVGNVYFTDQPNDRIMKWTKDGTITEWMKPAGRSNGLFFSGENLIACADGKNELWSIAPDKKVSVLVDGYDSKLLNGPNDVWVRADGGLFFTDPLYARDYWTRDPKPQQTTQGVYFLAPTGKAVRVLDDLTQPNGIIGWGNTLYVADIGANKTYRYSIGADGTLTDRKLFCEMGSDGMTLDEKGNLYLTGQGVTAYSPKGEKIWHLDVPAGWTSNVTFGGSDRKMLFITASDKVFGLNMKVTGVQETPDHSFK